MDKNLESMDKASKYACPIQAGAALTNIRTCKYNDLDDCDTNISERNCRYSEATAMYWIGKHLDTDYVGILHYRRRLDLTDAEYENFMSEGVDIITTTPTVLNQSIEKHYRNVHYSTDWDLMMELIGKHDPENYDFALQCFKSDSFHSCNINIYRKELYHEFCNWAFPILNDFYLRSPQKTDIYERRDVGFICERLSHLFVMKKKQAGLKIVEADLVNLKSVVDNYYIECKDKDAAFVYEYCDKLYRQKQITKCFKLIRAADEYGLLDKDKNLSEAADIICTAVAERKQLSRTLHDYLPEDCRSDLPKLISTWNYMRRILAVYLSNPNDKTKKIYNECIKITGFSEIAISIMKEQLHINS